MDYSEALIQIQQAKDKASQACKERDWTQAAGYCSAMCSALAEFVSELDRQLKLGKMN
jgi:hypothetical protein